MCYACGICGVESKNPAADSTGLGVILYTCYISRITPLRFRPMGIKWREFTSICLIPVVNPQASRAITMLRSPDCVNLLAPAGRQVCRNVDTPNSKAPEGRQVDNCVRHLPRENRVTRPKTLNLIPMPTSQRERIMLPWKQRFIANFHMPLRWSDQANE